MNVPPPVEPAETGMQKPDPRVVWIWHSKSTVWALILLFTGVAAGVALVNATGIPWVVVFALIALGWLGLTILMIWHNHAYLRSWGYRFDTNHLRICYGVVTRRTIDVPFSRVQHVDLEEGPMERQLGLARLILFTAGTSAARQEIVGLPRATAGKLRNQLLQHRQLLLPPDSDD